MTTADEHDQNPAATPRFAQWARSPQVSGRWAGASETEQADLLRQAHAEALKEDGDRNARAFDRAHRAYVQDVNSDGHLHADGVRCWTHSTCEALAAVAELRLFAIRKDDHEVSVRLDQIEAALKGQQVQ